MKKIYFFLLGLFALFGVNTAQARDIVSDTTTWVTDLKQLQTGDNVLLYCYGESSRRAFVYEDPADADMQLLLSRNFQLNTVASTNFIFKIVSITTAEDGSSAQLKLKAHSGHVFGNFPYDESSTWTKWPGKLYDDESQMADLTVTIYNEDLPDKVNGETVTAKQGDGYFLIMDGNSIYFNGQEAGAKFVGWNTTGANSIYRFKKATVVEKNTINVTINTEDQDGNPVGDGTYTQEMLPGDSITAAKSFDNYTFKTALDFNEDTIVFPYHITEETLNPDGEVIVTYKYDKWPEITMTGVDEEGNILFTDASAHEIGTKFTAPNQAAVKLGWELTTTDYNDHVYTTDDDGAEWTLNYKKNPESGMPFKTTTITDGKFAPDTKFYRMRIRKAGWIYTFNNDTTNVNINTGSIVSDSIENYVWAFTGNLNDGFQIYNAARGAAQKLYIASTDNATVAQLGTDETITAAGEGAQSTFNMTYNTNGGYTFAAKTDATACLNQSGGASSAILATWTNGSSPNDGGSSIVFTELTADEVQAYKFLNANLYLKAEGTVGGFKADQLTELKSAVAAKDLAACQKAIATLKTVTDTIAFDPSKTYNITAAYPGFIIKQPTKTYALYATADDSVRWGELKAGDEAYQWVFSAASDTTYTITNLPLKKAIVGWRYGGKAGGQAVLDGAVPVGEHNESNTFATGEVAPFQIMRTAIAPGAYKLVHNYGGSIITISGEWGYGKPEATGGVISTYNTIGSDYNNVWHLVAVGDVPTGITSVITPAEQTETIYDLSGRRVSKATQGLYIINGKKVLVK